MPRCRKILGEHIKMITGIGEKANYFLSIEWVRFQVSTWARNIRFPLLSSWVKFVDHTTNLWSRYRSSDATSSRSFSGTNISRSSSLDRSERSSIRSRWILLQPFFVAHSESVWYPSSQTIRRAPRAYALCCHGRPLVNTGSGVLTHLRSVLDWR